MAVKEPSTLADLPVNTAKVFDQAQVSTANHQKNFVALHKLHSDAARFTQSVNKGKSVKLTGERAFEDAFICMVARILPIKKGATQADRIVKFVGGYTKFTNEKAAEQLLKQEEDNDDDSTASRFTARLLRFFLKGFLAKDKTVRYRVLQLVTEMVSHLGEIDEEMYTALRAALLERIHDKESTIRVQAVISLAKLSGTEDPADFAGELTVTDVLIETLTHDPAAEVRRATLLNIPLTSATLVPILDRTRDTDTTIRKLVYSTVLDPTSRQNDTVGGISPRALTIAQRELIVRNGLGDREPAVRAAAAALLASWLEVLSENMVKDEKTPARAGGTTLEDDVVTLLKMFDLSESSVAGDALLSVFATRVDLFDNLQFTDQFWLDLTPEKAFLARVFVDHCITTKDDARLESALPVVTALAYRIQSSYNDLLGNIQAEEEERLLRGDGDHEDRVGREEARIDREFVIGEMLKLAVNLDYADEIGRRKMFTLVRDMISQDSLPENLVAKCLDVLRVLSANERDLIRVVVEVVHDLRDPSDGDDDMVVKADDAETSFSDTPATVKPARALPKPVAEMSDGEKRKADAIDLRCLSLCIGMLERVNGTLEENSTLDGILGELIVPAVKRRELALREKGLVSLGLCCLIARRMALSSFQLFISQIQSSPEVLKIRVLQIVFDILMMHEGEFLEKEGDNADKIITFLLTILGQEESPKILALIGMGLAKLMLAGMITDERVLKDLVVLYLSPETADNQELRQCLSYFFPVYCYSSPPNQRRVQQIFLPMFDTLSERHRELDEDQEMVSPAQVGGIFVDWTDPQKAVDTGGQTADNHIHFDMASDIVKALYAQNMEKDDKKVLCQLLNKLYIPDVVDDDKLRTLKLLMINLPSRRPFHDATANNAFTRFDAAISKKFEKQLQDFNEEEYRKLEELKALFEFLDDIIPEDDGETIDIDVSKKKGRAAKKRRSDSIISSINSDDDGSVASKRSKTQGRAKRRRVSGDDESSFDDDDIQLIPPPPSAVPTRTLPKRSAAARKKVVIEIHDTDDDESTPAPAPPKRAAKPRTSSGTRAQPLGEADLETSANDLGGESYEDSILDGSGDSEDDADEVSELLAS